MLSFAAGYQFEAMVEAAIAFDLASATNLGTLFHHRIATRNVQNLPMKNCV
jgi:hypothetical protein